MKHTHKYLRVLLNKKKKDSARVFKCVIPECHHFIAESLVEGRVTVCWVCNSRFAMTKKSAKLMKPHCANCYSRTDLRNQPTPAVKLEEAKKDWAVIMERLKEEAS